jgi:hypothetical protein
LFYEQINNQTLPIKLKQNEYILLYNQKNEIIDKYKYTKKGYVRLYYTAIENKMFGKIKPADEFQ